MSTRCDTEGCTQDADCDVYFKDKERRSEVHCYPHAADIAMTGDKKIDDLVAAVVPWH